MLSEADIAPIAARLDDSALAVRRQALRVIGLLLPVVTGDALIHRLHRIASESDEQLRGLAATAIDEAMRLADAGWPASVDDAERAAADEPGRLDDTVLADDPSRVAELVAEADRIADDYLLNPSEESWSVPDVIRYLPPERGALLVVARFAHALRLAFSHQQPLPGNSVVMIVAAMGSGFVADVPALAELYLETFRQSHGARGDWYRTGDESFVYSEPALALGWQIAWTASRAGIVDVITGVTGFLVSPEEAERLGALALLEDALRFQPYSRPPLYGGVTEPESDGEVVAQSVWVKTATIATRDTGYTTVQVFFGTDREPTGSSRPGPWFGSTHGGLSLGVCEVTMPSRHRIGELESPSWYQGWSRLDRTRYVLVQSIEPQPEAIFLARLRDAIQSSTARHALLFVHGYRVSFENAARRAAQLSQDLQIEPALLYSWPSKERLFGYVADETLAQASVPTLRQFLDLIVDRTNADTIHVIAHSMGCLALSLALRNDLSVHQATVPQLRDVILAAPDIDATLFREQIAPAITGKGARTTLYASRRDYALLTSRWLRAGLARAGFVESDTPLVVAGVETVDVSAVNCELAWGFLQGHSYVGDRPEIVQDMYELLCLGKSARDRFGCDEKKLNDLPYWVMKPRRR
jgi:esterase/lipase superfamily enzyme